MQVASLIVGRTFGGYQAINCTGAISEADLLPSSFTTKSLCGLGKKNQVVVASVATHR